MPHLLSEEVIYFDIHMDIFLDVFSDDIVFDESRQSVVYGAWCKCYISVVDTNFLIYKILYLFVRANPQNPVEHGVLSKHSRQTANACRKGDG